ncbi:MAG TPA: hypothetical protein VLC93_13610 [Myxococcota bacterium]|nr:hypothetical protein [Myxococcota bacterium]
MGETRRLAPAQAVELKIGPFGRSDLPEFDDSRFVALARSGGGYDIARVRDLKPLVGVEIALNLPEVVSLFIHASRMTSERPDLKGAKFAVRQSGHDEFRVTRLTQGT